MRQIKICIRMLAAACLALCLLAGCGARMTAGARNLPGMFLCSATPPLMQRMRSGHRPAQRLFRLGLHPLRRGGNAVPLYRYHGDRAVARRELGAGGRADLAHHPAGQYIVFDRPAAGRSGGKGLPDATDPTHDRARDDLQINAITAEGQTVTIVTREPRPALLHYLSDPYSCIIDMQEGVSEEGIVSGTGPYIAQTLVTKRTARACPERSLLGRDAGL